MQNFSDFNTKPISQSLVGDKLKIENILNREVTVVAHKIKPSKYGDGNKKCLHLQLKIGEFDYVTFVGSNSLIEQINQLSPSQFPFKAKITKQGGQLIFT